MTLQTEKMIYANEALAKSIKSLLNKEGSRYTVYKVPQGYQVVPVTKLKPHMPPAKPLPLKGPGEGLLQELADNEVFVKMQLRDISNAYLNGWHPVTGQLTSFGKTTLLSWEVSPDGADVTMRMLKRVATRRGLLLPPVNKED